jgi:hypothetical protein
MDKSKESVLINEVMGLVGDRAELQKSQSEGQLQWVQLSAPNYKTRPETWVLKAHIGTIGKLQHLTTPMSLEQDMSLIALARNVFENLIWLKLFNLDRYYGLVFYRQLLQQQLDSQAQAIEKVREEIELFKELDKEDAPDFDSIFDKVDENTSKEEKAAIISDHIKQAADKIDLKARSAFSIYADQAKTNGYGFQAHLIEQQAIPQHKGQIAVLTEHMEELLKAVPAGIAPQLQAEFQEKPIRWNWADRALKLGMNSEYKFLYAFTSRLLHSTPLSLVTPAALDLQERCLLLDYIYLTINEIYSEISSFVYPGKISVIKV